MQIITKPINELLPAGYNPRKDLQPGDPEYEKIARSIEEFGYVDPIIWNQRTGHVVSGHQRLKVLKAQGKTEVDVSVVDYGPAQEMAANVAFNKVGGTWDEKLLADLLRDIDLQGEDPTKTGFDEAEIEELLAKLDPPAEKGGDDFDDALPTVPITRVGDVWTLGRHRLVCGDSTQREAYAAVMRGELADLILTDPPYNVNYEGGTKEALKIQNDHMSASAFHAFLSAAYGHMYSFAADGAGIYVFHSDTFGHTFRQTLVDSGFKLAQVCIWIKNSLVMGQQDYQWQHEPVLYGWKPTGAHRWYSDRRQTTLWEFDRPTASKLHPTMKPLALLGYPIENSTKRGALVLDPFGGSGSTLIACENTGRTCRMIELDPRYCDVIIRRFEDATGQKAVREAP